MGAGSGIVATAVGVGAGTAGGKGVEFETSLRAGGAAADVLLAINGAGAALGRGAGAAGGAAGVTGV